MNSIAAFVLAAGLYYCVVCGVRALQMKKP